MLAICVLKEKASYDGSKDHAYRELYAFMLTLQRMWEAKDEGPTGAYAAKRGARMCKFNGPAGSVNRA